MLPQDNLIFLQLWLSCLTNLRINFYFLLSDSKIIMAFACRALIYTVACALNSHLWVVFFFVLFWRVFDRWFEESEINRESYSPLNVHLAFTSCESQSLCCVEKGKTILYPPVSSRHKSVQNCLLTINFLHISPNPLDTPELPPKHNSCNAAAQHNRTIQLLLLSLSLSQAHHWSVFWQKLQGAAKAGCQIACPICALTFSRGKKITARKSRNDAEGSYVYLLWLHMYPKTKTLETLKQETVPSCNKWDWNKQQTKHWKKEFMSNKIRHLD